MSERTCSIEGCGRRHYARTVCKTHYGAWWRGGGTGRGCTVEGCKRPVEGRGLCQRHYARWARTFGTGRECVVKDCERPHYARGWCSIHYNRWRSNGDPSTVKHNRIDHRAVVGARRVTERGYVLVKAPGHSTARVDGWAYEHRKVWYDANGPIPDAYDVHHLDHDRANNDLSNLMLIQRGDHRGAHTSVMNAVKAFYRERAADALKRKRGKS